MGGYELNVRAKHCLYFFNNRAFYAGDVGKQGAGLKVRLIFVYPLHKNMGIQGENNKFRPADDLRVRLGTAEINYSVFKGIVNILTVKSYGGNLKTEFS